ncbi:MAG: LysR family transcriptional regulator [Bdellovibrionales bacterium]|nr:LysR family transcriptional regulator [Bdellovibrionales bacterium]
MNKELNLEHLKKIWYLKIISDHKSLQKAAANAKVSPSAISQSLTSLEKIVGKPLVIREKGLARLTPEAMILLEKAQLAFDAVENLNFLESTTVPKMTWLNFGAYESIAIDILPGLVERLRNTNPMVKLGLRISRSHQLISMVRKGELCSAVITETEDRQRLKTREIGRDTLGLYVSKNFDYNERTHALIDRIGYGTLSPSRAGLPRYFVKFKNSLGLKNPALMSDSFETLRVAASSGAIAAILPARVAHRNDDLVEIGQVLNPKSQSLGDHGIWLIGQSACDSDEFEFLARETSRFL